MRNRRADALAALVVALEALGVLVVAGWMVVAFLRGDLAVLATAIALLVSTLIAAVALAAFAVAIVRGSSWGRSGAIVAQLLILAIALGALTGVFSSPGVAVALAVPAVLGLVALVFATREAGRERG